jgi:ABC-type branched-subunit amino acid transport system substrate-binding protein
MKKDTKRTRFSFWKKVNDLWKTKIGKFIIPIVSFILLAVAASIIDKVFNITADKALKDVKKNFYLSVIMSKSGKAFKVPEEFLTGFGSRETLLTDNGRSVDIHYEDDFYDNQQAERIAHRLARDNNCILVIGCSNSELTNTTINVFMQYTSRPAMILPIATNTDLILIATQENYNTILRMVPDDENQTRMIQSFVASHTKNGRVIILVDEENKKYSNDLSKSLAEKIIKNNGQIITMKEYGNSSRFIDIYSKLNKTNLPELIIFAGVSNNGLILIDELNSMNIDIPVLFTDGCAVETLIKRADSYKGLKYVLSSVNLSRKTNLATYEPIGKDAFDLVKKIINDSGGISRMDINTHIQNNKTKIILEGGNAGSYEFGEDGNNKRMNFIVYKILNGQLALEQSL